MELFWIYLIFNVILITRTTCSQTNRIYIKDLINHPLYQRDHKFHDLSNSIVLFRNSIVFDSQTNYLLVSTLNAIIKLSTDLQFKIIEDIVIDRSSNYKNLCYNSRYEEKYPCHLATYWIEIINKESIQTRDSILFICHYNSSLTFHNMSSLSQPIKSKFAACMTQSLLTLVDVDLNFYVASPSPGPIIARFHTNYPDIMKGKKKNTLFSLPNSFWIQQNDYEEFIYLFQHKKFVYLLIKEMAEENNIACKTKVIKSRIIRVSKDDDGGNTYRLKDNWTTFVKATLICPDESEDREKSLFVAIQSAYFEPSRELLYSTFNGGPSSPNSGAICIYSISDITQSFDGPFYDPDKPDTPVPERYTNCPDSQEKCRIGVAVKYQLKFHPILPIGKENSLVTLRNSWLLIKVMSLERSANQYDVIFVTTSDCTIDKYYRKVTNSKLCFLESLVMPCSAADTGQKYRDGIRDVQVINSYKSTQPFLVVALNHKIYKLPIERCQMYQSSLECADVFCYWNKDENRCVSLFHITVVQLRQLPDIAQCRNSNDNVADITMTYWSSWLPCSANGQLAQCSCRSRQCKLGLCVNSNPIKDNTEVQIRNCTFHNNWSAWNEWGACSATCGMGVQSRSRWCFQASNCDGPANETRLCQSSVKCKDSNATSKSPWSKCSVDCGIGESYRRRARCPAGSTDAQCNIIEIQPCQGPACKKITKSSKSIKVNINGENKYLTGLCSTDSLDDSNLDIFVEYQFENYTDLEESITTCWSDWSNCSNCHDVNNKRLTNEKMTKKTRNRKCKLANDPIASSLCFGKYEESEKCDDVCKEEIYSAGFGPIKYELVYIIIVGVSTFAISCLTIIIVFYICMAKKLRNSKNTNSLGSQQIEPMLTNRMVSNRSGPAGSLTSSQIIYQPQHIQYLQQYSPLRTPSDYSNHPLEYTANTFGRGQNRPSPSDAFFPASNT